MTFLNDKLLLNNVKVNIVLSHTFGPRQELHILRLEFYVRQQNQSTQFSDFKAKIVNVNLRILILKTKNQGHRSISQWWSFFSLKLKRKIRMRIIIISSFSKWKSIYLLYRKFDIVLNSILFSPVETFNIVFILAYFEYPVFV